MWNLKRNDTKELNVQNRLTDFEDDLMVARAGAVEGRMGRG